MTVTEPVLLEDLQFEDPLELRHAARVERAELARVASEHGIELAGPQTVAAVRSAIDAGHVRSAVVILPDITTELEVVDRAGLVAGMERFFGEVKAGTQSFGSSGPPSPSSRSRHRSRELIGRWVWTRPGRWIAERLLRSPQQFLRLAWSGPVRPSQVRSEILGLLERMHALRPRRVLEIGTARGGTTYLLSHFAAADGHVVTCDLTQRGAVDLQRGNRRRQTIETLELDSHSAEGRRRLHDRFPDGVDMLFIDGDHTYEGVRQDFLDYADLLRPRSLLVFHDIVEDFRTRYGIATWSWVGGVPRFWRELKAAAPSDFVIEELVRDPKQDGLGIGVVICPDDAAPGRALVAALTAGA